MEIHIKNMVCRHCKMVLANELEKIEGLEVEEVGLGWARLAAPLTGAQESLLVQILEPLGFELIDSVQSRITKDIKTLVINEIHHQAGELIENENFSSLIERKMGYDYSYLNELFAESEGITIGQFVIQHKVEKTKELLVYGELSLAEIADQLGYNSSQYLSAQFKKYTGLSPSHFRKIGKKRRKNLDQI